MHRRDFLCNALLGAFFCGCAAQRKPDYSAASGSAIGKTATVSGVSIFLDPFMDEARTRKFFGIGPDDGIAIMHARLVNTTTDKTFLVRKENFRLLIGSADMAAGQRVDTGTAGGEATALVGAAVGGLALMFAGLSMLSQQTEVRRNFVSKELPDQTLGASSAMEGFLYFPGIKKRTPWVQTGTVVIDLTETSKQEIASVRIPLA